MDQQEVLDARYGRTRRSKRAQLIFGVSVAAVASVGFLVWAVFVTQVNATTPTGKTISYMVVSDAQTRVDFTVEQAGDRAIECELQALDQQYGVVGDTQVEYAPGTTQASILVNTVKRAVTGIVKACWVK
ncbi:MAG: DUF4307 domain-containing protein [Micrococcales bacterium]